MPFHPIVLPISLIVMYIALHKWHEVMRKINPIMSRVERKPYRKWEFLWAYTIMGSGLVALSTAIDMVGKMLR